MDIDFEFWLWLTSTLLYYTIYPVLVVATWLFFALRLILSPFIYLAWIFKEVVLLPIRVLAQFEVSNIHWSESLTDTQRRSGTSSAQLS